MKVNKRRLFIIGIVLAIIIIAIVLVLNGNKNVADKETEAGGTSQEPIVIQNKKMAEVKKYEGLEFSDLKVEINDELTTVTANVKNTTSQDMDGQWINVNVLNKKGDIITTLGGYIDPVSAGSTTPLQSAILTNTDDRKAEDIQIVAQDESAVQKVITQ